MRNLSPSEHFQNARKLGMKEYSARTASGQIGYLPSLEGLLKNSEIVSHVELGTMEIPLKKIVGTYTHLRSLSFANNFMPIIGDDAEFESKWVSLCDAHLNEGIRDPIKVYEYLNWYYVIEGNKRVSILKYFDAYSMHASITRLIPRMDETNPDIQKYYEFLKFNNLTRINSIWFTDKSGFSKLAGLLEDYDSPVPQENKFKYFEKYIYNSFRSVYHSLDGCKIPLTTGDAFLEFAKIYGIPEKFDETKQKKTIAELIKELDVLYKKDLIDIQTAHEEVNQSSVLSALTTLIHPPKKIKAVFLYARTIDSSGWTYCHELGRKHLEQALGDMISTSYVENVPENEDAYHIIKEQAKLGYDIIFTTSPVFRNATLKCALKYPDIKFFNCSENRPYKHLSNYYGRTYEPRFLTGIIAGSMTRTNIIGYAATSPTPEVLSCINAYALGAKMVNPYAKVKVTWTREWNSHDKFQDADKKLMDMGADIISNRNLSVPREVTVKYGVYSMLCSMDLDNHNVEHHLAAPIWHWGAFYEKIMRNIMNETYKTLKDMFNSNSKLVNFWWGMESGILDIYYSDKYLPTETQKLVKLMKKMIISNDFNPFIGPLWDNRNQLRLKEDETASNEQVLKMNWYIDNVEAESFEK